MFLSISCLTRYIDTFFVTAQNQSYIYLHYSLPCYICLIVTPLLSSSSILAFLPFPSLSSPSLHLVLCAHYYPFTFKHFPTQPCPSKSYFNLLISTSRTHGIYCVLIIPLLYVFVSCFLYHRFLCHCILSFLNLFFSLFLLLYIDESLPVYTSARVIYMLKLVV